MSKKAAILDQPGARHKRPCALSDLEVFQLMHGLHARQDRGAGRGLPDLGAVGARAAAGLPGARHDLGGGGGPARVRRPGMRGPAWRDRG